MTSSSKYAVPFRINLKTSFILNGALLFMYLGAFYWLFVFDLNLLVKAGLTAALLGGLIIHSRQYLFKNSKRAVTNMVWLEQNLWQLDTAVGESIDARLLGSSFMHPWLIILNFKPEHGGRMLPVVVMPDSVDSTTFRRLCAKLKLYGGGMTGEAVQ